MTYSTKITSKGQATIPKPVRDSLGVGPGDFIRFEIKEGQAVLEGVKKTILDYKGALRGERPAGDWAGVREAVKREVARKAVGT